MNTYLGSCTELGIADVTAETVATPKLILLEGYVWDIAEGPALAKQAMMIAAENGSAVTSAMQSSIFLLRSTSSLLPRSAQSVAL